MTPKWKDVDTSGDHFIQFIYLVSLTKLILIFFFFADKYTELCTIEADLSRVPKHSRPKTSGKGNFYRVDYDIILLFGMTELNAQIAWKEKVSGHSIKRISD